MTVPVPRLVSVLSERSPSRWMTLSRHPGSRPVSLPLQRDRARLTARPFTWSDQRRSRAAHRPSLGPRSLAPPLFLERCVRAYSRPDAAFRFLQRFLRRTGNKTRALAFLTYKTMAATTFLVLTHRARP